MGLLKEGHQALQDFAHRKMRQAFLVAEQQHFSKLTRGFRLTDLILATQPFQNGHAAKV